MQETVRETLRLVAAGITLSAKQAEQFMNALMEGKTSPVQTAGLLAAMTVRGETVEEIVGFAKAMKSHAVPLHVPFDAVDTCGTGGDGAKTFNISTASAFAAAGAGAYVAKHGNRAISSQSGSADVLQALGANIDLEESQALDCLTRSRVCFLFAPYYHPAMKYAAQTRKELGFRTIFNILGPLTNPVEPKRQVIGVFRPELVRKVADALCQLGSEHALVVHGDGGIDEFSLSGETLVAEVKAGTVREFRLTPEEVGIQKAPLEAISGGTSEENAEKIRRIFSGERGPDRDVVVYNTGAVLYVTGLASSIEAGVILAAETLDTGRALETLNNFVSVTKRLGASEVAQ